MAKKIELTKGQKEIFNLIKVFATDNVQKVFILKGYAGTGKTTLVKYIINYFVTKNIRFQLLATTGRAATILADITGQTARTIHSQIYKFKDLNQDVSSVIKEIDSTGVDASGQLYLNFELKPIDMGVHTKTIYIVDESSMLSNVPQKEITQAAFGSGKLLSDLLRYDPHGKFIFVGDACQLPPIEQTFSPALSTSYFNNELDILANSRELTEIVRQKGDNDIVDASILIRQLYAQAQEFVVKSDRVVWGKLPFRHYDNIVIHPEFNEFLEEYISCIKQYGYDYSTLICESNKKTRELSLLVRQKLGFSGRIQVGDLLLVTQNNNLSGLINGDFLVVKSVSPNVERRGQLTFRHVELEDLSTKTLYSQLMIEEVLYSNTPNLDKVQQKSLTLDFVRRMAERGLKQNDAEFVNRMMDDPYYNALRCVYGYAITCHKSQGGEWPHVFVDLGKGRLMANPTKSSYQWIYTAMTRAKMQLHLVDGFYIEGYSAGNRGRFNISYR